MLKLTMDNIVTIVLMVLGVVLFFAALWVVAVLLKQKKNLMPAYGLFGFSLIMIGFSAISTISFPGGGGLSKSAKAVEMNPTDAKAVAALETDLDKHLNSTTTNQLAPKAEADLSKAVASLSARTNLSAESRITLSKAQLVLGRTNQAAATLRSAVAANPRLATDPRMRAMLRRVE